MKNLILVTGANGHLGNNLTRRLVSRGAQVRAGLRNMRDKESLNGVNCDITHMDLSDKESLCHALEGVDTLYQVAAVFKHWAKDPEKEIIQPNLMGTKNILEAAAYCKVKKIIYVSSITALDGNQKHIDESGWNNNPANPYYRSKTEAEKLALRITKENHLNLISVLPAAMVGPHCYGDLTPTMRIIDTVLKNKQPIDPCFHINFVSIEDVVDGMIAAAERGKNGQRYILGSEKPVSTTQIFKLAKSIHPDVKTPPKLPKLLLVALAKSMELVCRLSGKEPPLTPQMVKTYYKNYQTLDLSKSRRDLGYLPQGPEKAIRSSMDYLMQRCS